MGLGKCTGWPFHDLDPRLRLWHPLAKICLSARYSENHSSDHYKTLQFYCPSHGYYLIRCWRSSVGNFYFGKFLFLISDVFFSRSNTILVVSQEWLVRLMWNEKEVHRLDTGHNMWPWPLTSLMILTLDVSRSNFEIAFSQELLVWLMWNENEVSWYDTGPIVWPCPLTTPMTLTLELNFQGRVWNSFISGMGRQIDLERKGYESSIHDHDID